MKIGIPLEYVNHHAGPGQTIYFHGAVKLMFFILETSNYAGLRISYSSYKRYNI